MRIGAYQTNPLFGEVKKNVIEAVEDLSQADADLVVLPELFNTGYQFVSVDEVADLAEEIPSGRTCQAMMSLARDRDLSLVFGLAEKDNGRFFNSAAIVGPAGFVGKYRKTHLFDEEKDFFSPGDTGFRVFEIDQAVIGVMICFDWWFPESARSLALLGADIICHPANLVLPQCQQAMLTRSLENGVFTITANRVGSESRGGKARLLFTGQSQIVDRFGKRLARLSEEQTGLAVTTVSPEEARNKGIARRNDRFADRRPRFYQPLVRD
ncbi:MAG: nitrilase-related carbon-nitrogen hydrolase [Desulfatiglans sp.]|jgi:predicted amidohydrolase|nr:nitrilase-related carbon-nitrogen hydrolase [Desulfatiglans sp.]